MQDRESFFLWVFTDAGRAVVAGAAGGLVRWLTLQERPRDGIASIIVGALCALYLGPLAVPIFEPVVGKIVTNPDQAVGFAAFLIGMGGLSVSAIVIQVWRLRRANLAKGESDGEDGQG